MPPGEQRRSALRKAVEVGVGAADRQHTRVRSFRNVVLVTALLLAVLVVAFAATAGWRPQLAPPVLHARRPAARPARAAGPGRATRTPRSWRSSAPSAARSPPRPDPQPARHVHAVRHAGGAVAAQGARRGADGRRGAHRGAGRLRARPERPRLQEQILAYALVFGYAQQLLTRFVDERAGAVLDSIPSKDASVGRPARPRTCPSRRRPRRTRPRHRCPPGPCGAATRDGDPPGWTTPEPDGADEPDVLHLVDTEPVALRESELGEGYDALRDEHFGRGGARGGRRDEPADVLDGVVYAADETARPGGDQVPQINGFPVDSAPSAIGVRAFRVPGTEVASRSARTSRRS